MKKYVMYSIAGIVIAMLPSVANYTLADADGITSQERLESSPSGKAVAVGWALPTKISGKVSDNVAGQAEKAEVVRKMKRLHIPFITNEGQVNGHVKFYTNTFGGTVFVTEKGEIVYSLPEAEKDAGTGNNQKDTGKEILFIPDLRTDAHICRFCKVVFGNLLFSSINGIPVQNRCRNTVKQDQLASGQKSRGKGISLREEIIGGKIAKIEGEGSAVTKVNYFRGSNPLKWKSNIATYDTVSLGEIYEGIEVKFRAYGDNVEKLFTIKPGADPGQIKISLSGIQPPESHEIVGELFDGFTLFNPSYINLAESSLMRENQVRRLGGTKCIQQNNVTKGTRGLWVNENGELEVETELGPVKFTKPVAYQEIDDKRVEVAVEYELFSPQVIHRKDAKNAKEDIVGGMDKWSLSVLPADAGSTENVCPLLAGVKGVEKNFLHIINPQSAISHQCNNTAPVNPNPQSKIRIRFQGRLLRPHQRPHHRSLAGIYVSGWVW